MSSFLKQVQNFTAGDLPLGRKARERETEHRIKNHLQLIGSSIALQARECVHAEAREILLQTYGRVSAVARLHARFQATVGLREIQIADFINEVCADLSICFNAKEAPVQLEVDIAPRRMAAGDALTLGLIVNELITNAVKHAPQGRSQLVRIRLYREERKWRLTVHDNGPGLSPESFDVGANLGARLLHALAAQMGGTLRVDQVNEGASISVLFN